MPTFLGDVNSRNSLWLSPEISAKLASIRVAIVGCGGTGVLVACFLTHIGVRNLTLVDADKLEVTNLNRFIIGSMSSIGALKVEIIHRHLKGAFAGIEICTIAEKFPRQCSESDFRDVDYVFGCLDNVHSRIELDVFCRKLGVTLIDIGSGFRVDPRSGSPCEAGGQVLISRVGGACLMCLGFSDLQNMNGYYLGSQGGPDPSSILVNSIVASMAAEVLLQELTVGADEEGECINVVRFSRDHMTIMPGFGPVLNECSICACPGGEGIDSVGEAGSAWRS